MAFKSILLVVLSICQLLNANTLFSLDPPPPSEIALTARYIIHIADWVTISTTSTLKIMKGYPLGNVKAVSDGPTCKGTGVPYFYVTPEDLTGMDMEVDNKCTLTTSLAQTDYCVRKDFDVQDPRCSRVIISGHLLKLDNKTEEYKFAKSSLFSRHPQMADWPAVHSFFVAKLNVENVLVMDDISGKGFEFVPLEDYFNANEICSLSNQLQKNFI